MRRATLINTFFLTMALLAACEKPPALKVGDTPGKATLTHLNGKQTTIPGDLAGNVVMIRFWADWCSFCKDEMTELEPIYRKYKNEGLIILAINTGQSKEKAVAFVEPLGISYDVLVDPDSAVARLYGVSSLPTTFILNRHGVVAKKVLGDAGKGTFEKLLDEALQ